MSTVIPLHREAAYTPLDKPGRCQTPKHEGREARSYPGGRLCDPCISRSRQSYRTHDNHRDDHLGDPR